MDRYWLLTWTTYGTWLPGDARGFVSNVADADGKGVRHNEPSMPYDARIPVLDRYMRQQLQGNPIFLSPEHASVLVAQFQETARHRGWLLLAVAIMANHVHVLVGVPGDPDPDHLLRDFKSYGSRALNRQWGKALSGTWLTESGSKRKKATDSALCDAFAYVKHQHGALRIWVHIEYEMKASGGRQPPVSCETEPASESAKSTGG